MYRRTVYAYAIIMIFLFIAALGTGSAALGNSTYIEAVGRQSTYTLTIATPRKTIYDRNLQPITNAEQKYIAAVVPSVESIGKIQSVTDDSQRNEVYTAFENGKPFLIDVNTPIQTDGIATFTVFERYSDPQPAAHLVGYLENGKIGISGIEKSFDNELKECGEITVTFTVDAIGQAIQGAVIETQNDYERSDAGIALTLDRSIQSIVESSCTDILKGAAVVLECRTGNIIAIASYPTLDINNLEHALNDPNEPFINRALCAYSPGSVFKLLSSVAALENGADYRTTYMCNGSTEIDGYKFPCFDQIAHNEVNLHTALRQSCNGYFIHLVESIGADKVLLTAEKFNFGKEIDISNGLVSSAGALPSVSELCNPRAAANFSFGQGYLTTTPLHIAAFINTIASEGLYYTPKIFLGYVDDEKEISYVNKSAGKKIIEKMTADRLRNYMESTARFGTARDGCPQNCISGIKTGTAETGVFDTDGKEVYNYWYAGYICDKDEIPLYTIVIMEESSKGNHVPKAFKKIAETLADFT